MWYCQKDEVQETQKLQATLWKLPRGVHLWCHFLHVTNSLRGWMLCARLLLSLIILTATQAVAAEGNKLSWWEPTVWVTWVMVPAHICYLVTRVCCTCSWLLPCNWNVWCEIVFVHSEGTLCGWRDGGEPGSKLVAMCVPWFEIQVAFPSPGRSGAW